LDVIKFSIIFAANLALLFEINKQFMKKNETLDVRVYYQKLGKTERGMMLAYLQKRYDYNPRTMSDKLNHPGRLLRTDERENIEEAIRSGAWRS
jgi:hypothetical protein